MKLFSKRESTRKKRQLDALLVVLLRTPETPSAETLGEASELGAAALPLLATLHERALIEPQWTQTLSGPALGYRLSAAGREHALRAAVQGSGLNLASPPTVKLLFTRLAALLPRTDTKQAYHKD